MRRLAVPALISAETMALAILHHLGSMPGFAAEWSDLFAPTTRLEDAIATGLRYVALALAYWLAISTLLYAAVRLTRVPAAIRTVGWLTLPAVRRVVDRALAVGLAFGIATTPLAAAAQETADTTPVVEHVFLPPPTGFYAPPAPPETQITDPAVVPPGVRARPLGTPDRAADVTGPPSPTDGHVVASGENLWSIAAARVEFSYHAPSETEIAIYWLSLIEANRHVLASGDPDLIYPGERLVLPPVTP